MEPVIVWFIENWEPEGFSKTMPERGPRWQVYFMKFKIFFSNFHELGRLDYELILIKVLSFYQISTWERRSDSGLISLKIDVFIFSKKSKRRDQTVVDFTKDW